MPFSHILGQDAALETLGGALRRGRVHHAYRFVGPDGTGKGLTALALAQALLCAGGDPLGCGRCDACRRALTFATTRPMASLHPDLKLVARGFYPPETIGRSREEISDISVDQVRAVVLANAAYPPHEGRARVIIVQAADELSVSAANAMLKTLEEPRSGTHFVLLTSREDKLLQTIRSRTLPLRFAPLSDEVIRGILAARGIPEERRELAIELAAGSASAALELCDDELSAARERTLSALRSALSAPDIGPAIAIAETRDKDRDSLRSDLRALAATFAREGRALAGSAPREAGRAANRFAAVSTALRQVDRNASASLLMVALLDELRRCEP